MPPRTQNPIQYWQLRSHPSMEQAAQRLGISTDRYRAVVVQGTERLTSLALAALPSVFAAE